jgi:multiple sugar transport system substrate-binding protein
MRSREQFVSPAAGRQALQMMSELIVYGHPASIGWNPPQLLDHMSSSDEVIYCPLLFGYSNYARPGYRTRLVHFADIPLGVDQQPSGAILGGAGLAVSRRCREPEAACQYAAYVASPAVQRGDYFQHSGQPGHRSAWLDAAVNAQCSDFFQATLPTLDHAYLRPRFNGYVDIQDRACEILHDYLKNNGDKDAALAELENVYCADIRT